MREILFRGFHPCEDGKERIIVSDACIEGRWVNGDFCKPCNIVYSKHGYDEVLKCKDYICYDDEVIPETIGQYTGLDDKNETKIFEGDIIGHRSNYSGKNIVCKVRYDEYYGAFMCEFENGQSSFLADLKNIEVIGNVFANPILKG